MVGENWVVTAHEHPASVASHRPILLALAHPELAALGDSGSGRRFETLIERYESTLQAARDARESIVGLLVRRRRDRLDLRDHRCVGEGPGLGVGAAG